jgi:hypothetical protein
MLHTLIRATIATALVMTLQMALLPTPVMAVQACVNNKTGAFRILFKGTCKKTETALALNSATQVVDSKGSIVGDAYPATEAPATFAPPPFTGGISGLALRQINDVWVALLVTTSGFVDGSDLGYLYEFFTTNNCTGTPYIVTDDSSGAFPPPLNQFEAYHAGFGDAVFNGVLYYAAPPIQPISFQSLAFLNPTKPPTPCFGVAKSAGAQNAGPLTTFDLSTLGLVPPFQLQ